MTHTVETTESNVVVVRFDDVCAGWEQWVMLSSDRHHDSPYCDRDKERRHLEKAKKRGALIVDCGDLFDAMQGKYDPRRSLDDVRPEDKVENYLDSIITHAAEDYADYARNWLVMGRGNHETSIRSHNGVDLTDNLAYRLNYEHAGRVNVGGFGGWVRFVFRINGTKSQSVNLKYFHGKSTRAPVTKGVIQTNRQAVYLPDADIVLNGHNHESYIVPIPRERLTIHGHVKRDQIQFVRTPGYKDHWKMRKGEVGFEAEQGSPKLTGCAWLRFFYKDGLVGREVKLEVG
jgi:hypothetical protein